jgi:uncharacterized protein (TIGR03435 family)
MKGPLVCLLAALVLDFPAPGQSTAFEVVSIKPAPQNKKELQQHLGKQIDPAMLDFGGVSLLILLTRAYGLHSFQVLGAPELNTTRFHIVAKLPTGSSTAQVPEMLKTMLRERFRLEAHQETRDFGVYALTAPKGVPKIPLKLVGEDPAPGRGLPPGTMAQAADFINQYQNVLQLSRPVVDQTGVEANHIDLASFVQPLLDAAIAARKDGADPMSVESAVLGAVRRLGLRLESRKASMTALVITHIELTPTPE